MLTNSNHIGRYGQLTTEWSGGITDIRSHHAAVSAGRVQDYAGVSTPSNENGFLIGRYTGKSFSLLLQDASPYNLYVTNDGTRMYVVGTQNNRIYQYSLSTPFDVSTSTFVNLFNLNTNPANALGIYIKSDGTRIFVLGITGRIVVSLTFGTPWDVTTLVYDNKSFNTQNQETSPRGITVNPDGTKFWIVGLTGIREYTMSTPWDLATTTYSKGATVGDTVPAGVAWNSTGTQYMVLGNTSDIIIPNEVTTPFDITGRVAGTTTSAMGNIIPNQVVTNPNGFYFVPGTKNHYVVDTDRRVVYWFTSNINDQLGVGVNSNRLAFSESFSLGLTTPRTVMFKPDGTTFYVSDDTTKVIRRYACTSPWVITGASIVQTEYIFARSNTASFTAPTRFFISNDGTDIYFSDFASGAMSRYGLTKAWDISAMFFKSSVTSALSVNSNGFCFSRDGLSLYYISGTTFFRKALSTPWDITTLATTATSFADSTYLGTSNTLTGVYIDQTGEYLYGVTAATARIYKYKMSVPWDITTASFYSHAYVEDNSPDPLSGLFMHPRGDFLFLTDQTNDSLYKFVLNGG